MIHNTSTIIPCIFSLLLRINAPTVYNIEHNQPAVAKALAGKPIAKSVISDSLPNDVMFKIFACADLATKKALRCTCTFLYVLDIKNILKHSPLIISRKDHLYHMVCTAQNNDSEIFLNLLSNAHNCEYYEYDIFSTISCFMPKDSEELKLLNMYCEDYNFALAQQLLPCIMAIYRGDEKYIEQYLIKNMWFPQHRKGVNPLHIAARNDHVGVLEIVLAHSTDINAQDNRGNTALDIAVCHNWLRIAQCLLENGADVNGINKRNCTPLLLASYEGLTEMVALLLAHKADACIGGKLDMPLHAAIINSHTPIVRMLIEYGVNTNEMYKGNTPLMMVVDSNNYDACELLLKNGAEIDATEPNGYTALNAAAEWGYLKIVQLLLAYGANINHQTKYHETALSLALKHEHADIVTFLLDQPTIKLKKKKKKNSLQSLKISKK